MINLIRSILLQSIEQETASFKQKKMEFEFEKATFNKQTEFAKNVLKKQDEEIKVKLQFCVGISKYEVAYVLHEYLFCRW